MTAVVTLPGRRVAVWGGLRFDWVMVVSSVWFLGGLYVDGWAHAHGKVDTSFFTPWHAIFYSGFAAVTAALAVTILHNRAAGLSWRRAVPLGYQASLVGAFIFALGGLGDLAWHTLFGIERGVEALYSPSHLTLALGIGLVVSGPLRAAWGRGADQSQGWRNLGPMVLSVTYVLALFSFFTEFISPLGHPLAAERYRSASDTAISLGMASILLQTAIWVGLVLFMLRRWLPPFGALTLILTLNALGIAVIEDDYRFVATALVAGLIADTLIWWLKPAVTRTLAWRVFAFAAPTVYTLLYFLTLWRTGGVGWSVHLWGGAVFLAGMVGLLLSYLVAPPPLPSE